MSSNAKMDSLLMTNPATQVQVNNNKSRDIYLDAVKGFLILCIMLEHNHLLTAQYDWIRPFSDAFAAGCFLILTFAWPLKSSTFAQFINKNFSYWWPFLGFVTTLSVLNFYLYKNNQPIDAILNYLNALFLASPQAIKASSGFMYLWFLPCLCFLYLTRRVLNYIGHYAYGVALISWLFIGEINDEILTGTPFSLHVIAFILLIGFCYSKLHKKMIHPSFFMKVFTISSLILCSIVSYFIGWKLFLAGGIIPSIKQPILLLFYSFFMLTAIPGIYHLFSLMPKLITTFFGYMGLHSMKLYLFHPLVYIVITQIIPVIHNPTLSFLCTVGLSLLISFVMVKLALLDNVVFPKTLSDLAFKRKS
jgi:hypothetical protein